MSTPITDAFVEIYTSEVLATYQDKGFQLPSFCKRAAVQGSKLYWHKLDQLETGDITKNDFTMYNLAGQGHGMVSIDTTEREVPSALHSLEMLKTNVDFRQGYVNNQLALLGRYADQQIVTAFNTGKNATILGPGFNVGLSIAHIHQLRETLDLAYIPNDGRRYAFVTPRVWSQLLQIEEFVNADYLGGDALPYAGAGLQAKAFQTINWVQFNDCIRSPLKSGGVPWVSGVDAPEDKIGNVARNMVWHPECMGHGVTKEPATTITFENLIGAYVLVTRMSMGATVVDDTGVFAFDVDEMEPVAA